MKPILSAVFLAVLFSLDLSVASDRNQYELDIFHRLRSKRNVQCRTNSTSRAADTEMMLNMDSPWENFLLPGPTVVALLGQLFVISTRHDFRLNETNPNAVFRYIRRPESFRATLVQVSHDAWSAFNGANVNMVKIELFLKLIPVHINTTIKIITKGTVSQINRLLPRKLAQIQTASQECAKAAVDSRNVFSNVMQMLGEVLENIEASRGATDDKYRRARQELAVSEQQNLFLQNYTEILRRRQEEMDVEVKKYQDAYKKAYDEIPTGWKAIGQNIVRAIVNLVNTKATFRQSSENGGAEASGSYQDVKTSHILAIMQQVFDMLGKMKVAANETFYGNSTRNETIGQFSGYNVTLRAFGELLKGLNVHNATEKAETLIQNATNICERMIGWYKMLNNVTDEFMDEVVSELDQLSNQIKPLLAASAYNSLGMSIQSDVVVPESTHQEHERYKAYLNLQLLQNARNRSDQIFRQMLQHQDKMMELLINMTRLNITQLNLQEITELLKDGIIYLSKIRQQWSILVEFFSIVSVRAEVALNQTLRPFIIEAESAIGLESNEERDYLKKTLLNQTSSILHISYFLQTLANIYQNVSENHVLPRLAGLTSLLAYKDDTAQCQRMVVQLKSQCQESHNEIRRLVQEKRQNFGRLVQSRIEELSSYVNSLGGPTEEEREAASKGKAAVEGSQAERNQGTGNPFPSEYDY